MVSSAPSVHAVGSKVWVVDEDQAWIRGTVVRLEGADVVVHTENDQERKCKAEQAPLQNQDATAEEDMTRLSYLHEPGVLWNLKQRYGIDEIYTYTGSILIAVNPFQSLPHLYGPHMMEQYKGMELGDLSPHVYAIAEVAYRQMRKEMKGQSILVSGESGAGKTETSKLIMKYLAYMGGHSDKSNSRGDSRSVEDQVLESNPLLEAFGNAKTVRNDNSSRFGKYVEINFNKRGIITGAAVRTYLLERSRVVSVNSPERSYHIFYQLCDGASEEERRKWYLRPAAAYHYLNQSTCFEIPGLNNAAEYRATLRSMDKVGIPRPQQEAILRTVAAVLHLGNISFAEGRDSEESIVAPGAASEHLTATALLLGVDREGLRHALTTRTRVTVEGPIVSPLNVPAATANRDSLAKIIYSKMFDWLVARINSAIGEDKGCAASVGVLDIYGFESFEYNDFEQFCINLANEKLQQHFNHHVFKQEQAEYEREQIDWSYIEFVDNQDVLDLIEGRMGVLDMLDEQCRFPTATGKDLADKLYTSPACKSSPRFSKPKRSVTGFNIEHYAGAVGYECANFLEKNKDFVVAEHQALLQASLHAFVRELFPPDADLDSGDLGSGPSLNKSKSFKGFKFNSVGSQFKRQLGELMAQLHAMEPHYVRCIKPNNLNKPSIFDNKNALHQLRCGGVLEAVRINCAGFPSKRTYADFVDHFWPLVPELYHREELTDRQITEHILKSTGLTGYQFGLTKVCLRGGQMAVLDKLRLETMNRAASIIQRHVRGLLMRQRFRRLVKAIMALQAGVRGMFGRREARFRRQTRAATVIQTRYRRYLVQKQYRAVQHVVVRFQALARGRMARKQYQAMRRERAALVIQTAWRRHRARRDFTTLRDAAVKFQNAHRSRVAKRQLRALRAEAREAHKILADKKALEIRLAEVQGTLETVQAQRGQLRVDLKDTLAQLQEAKRQIQALEQEKEALLSSANAEAEAKLAEEVKARRAVEAELAAAQQRLEEAAEAAAKDRADLESKYKVAQDYVQRLLAENADVNKRFHGMKEELITRLQNACAQRDEARGQVLELQAEGQKLTDKFEAEKKRLVQEATAAAAAAAAAGARAGPPGTPTTPLQPGTPADGSQSPVMGPDGQLLNGLEATSADRALNRSATRVGGYMQSLAPSSLAKAMLDGANSYLGGPQPISRSQTMPRMGAGDTSTSGTPESELERRTRELQAKQQQLIQEKRRQEEERLLAALASNMGFHKGKPVAALVIFRSCLQWRAFQADRTTVFDRIIQVVGSQIEKQQDDNACLAYWLTNTVTLLNLLQKNIKPSSNNSIKSRTAAAASRMFGGFIGRTNSLNSAEASIHGGGVGGFRLVEAKYPALLFKQQLDAFVQKIFPMMRDNVKKQITPMLANCIHTPKGAGRGSTGGRRTGGADHPQAQAVGAQLSKSWSDILGVLSSLLATCRDAGVPKVLVAALFRQLFSFVNVQLFNQLLLRRECCSFSNGEYVKTGLGLVEAWITEAGPEHTAGSWDELKFIRQAVTFLVIGNKPKKSLAEITRDLCPVLSIQQLYRISTMYWDDKYNTETVSPEVLAHMKQQMVDVASNNISHSFLLDDDNTLPFAAQDILAQIDDKDLYGGIPVPESLREGDSITSFGFLEKELRFSQM